MSTSWRHLPAPARAIATAATDAVAAAQQRDEGAFDEAVGRLGTLDADRTGLVLGAVVRLLLEELHPDGLDGDDVRTVLERSVRAAADWQPTVDPTVVLLLLAGALGVHDRDEEEQAPDPAALARHAPLLIADLLTAGGGPFAGYLAAAFAEIERAEVHD